MKKYYFLNTNRKLDPSRFDEQTMLKEGIAAAYQKKESIKNLRKGNVVFLYANEIGVVGCGIVNGPLEKRSYKSSDKSGVKEAYFKKLKDFVDISSNPVSLSEIKDIIGPIAMIQALFQISNTIGSERLHRECLHRASDNLKKVA